MRASKKMMYDDLAMAPFLAFVGIVGFRNEHPIGGAFLFLFACLWFGIRIYHFTHQDDVFGSDK